MLKNVLLMSLGLLIGHDSLSGTPRSQQLKVLTWNVFLRPRAILWGDHQAARAQEMVKLLQAEDYDVVVLQEAFDQRSIRILTEGLRVDYPYMLLPQKRNIFHINNGLMVLSRLPIEDTATIFFDRCAGNDCMADKGAVLIQVSKGEHTYQVIGTHAQAEEGKHYADIRSHQYAQIRELLIEQHAEKGMTQIVVGDLNTKQSQHLDYQMMLHSLGAENGEVLTATGEELPCDGIYTWGCSNNGLVPIKHKGNTSLLDYLLCRPNGTALQIERVLHIFKRKWRKDCSDLSDHYALSMTVGPEWQTMIAH